MRLATFSNALRSSGFELENPPGEGPGTDARLYFRHDASPSKKKKHCFNLAVVASAAVDEMGMGIEGVEAPLP